MLPIFCDLLSLEASIQLKLTEEYGIVMSIVLRSGITWLYYLYYKTLQVLLLNPKLTFVSLLKNCNGLSFCSPITTD
jgi:hypothetical protein